MSQNKNILSLYKTTSNELLIGRIEARMRTRLYEQILIRHTERISIPQLAKTKTKNFNRANVKVNKAMLSGQGRNHPNIR